MQQIDAQNAQQCARLLEELEQHCQNAINELEQQQIKQANLKAQYEANIKYKNQLRQAQRQLLNEIQNLTQRRITQLNMLINRAFLKFQEQQKVQALALQDPLSFRIPKVNMELKQIELPKDFHEVIQEYKGDFQKQKAILEQEITKIKIVIRLNQIKGEEGSLHASKSKRSQNSINTKR